MISVLIDFDEHMTIFQPLTQLFDSLGKQKTLSCGETFPLFIENIAVYFEHLPNLSDDAKANHMIATGWSELLPAFETFLRKLLTTALNPVPFNLGSLMRAMICALRAPVAANFKTILETFSALIRLIIETTRFHLPALIELCSICNRTFKERVKSQLTKTVTEMIHQALKFRISVPDENLMKLLQVRRTCAIF
ncbi:Protein unc-79 [Cichlidogyrus casuarinus]|uniref:Protein unc-79 n=1 Tax=Cichlidogyrus casuarinus TaxID=1844966 RepID=A0ABD2PXB8_9PLAT